jgi:DNA polymerase-3 subunit epsilon
MSTTKKRYWTIWFITAFLVFGIVAGVLGLFWSDLSVEERAFATKLAPKWGAYAITAVVVNLVLFASLLRFLFTIYLDPIAKLSEETRLIARANAKYRIVPAGGEEVVELSSAINALADDYIALKTDVQQIVQHSKSGLNEEKRRLVTLMEQIPEGVIVCNVDGRILLYNHKAQDIAHVDGEKGDSTGEGKAEDRDHGLLGLGRSVFGVLDRRPIVYALNYLQNQLDEGQSHPIFDFTTSRSRHQLIQVRMAAVGGARTESAKIDGYVLTINDITHRMQADSRRDIFLQSLTIGLQNELDKIKTSVVGLERDLEPMDELTRERTDTIGSAVDTLLEQIDAVAVQHAGRLQNPGDSEHIMAVDLMYVLVETLIEEFGVEVESEVESDLWLGINSYTVVRGVIYLMGQLTNHLGVKKIRLDLHHEGEDGYLRVGWGGDPVKVETIEEWKQCPLMTKARGQGPVSLENLLAGRGDVTSEEEATFVRFKLGLERPESKWSLETKKAHRPIFYEFDLFDADKQSTEFDDLPLDKLNFVVFDTETTGLDPAGGDEIISIGAIKIVSGKLRREEIFDQLVDPRRSIPLESLKIHEIYPEMLVGMPVIGDVLPAFHQFAEGSVLVAHNAAFDMRFLQIKEKAAGIEFSMPVLDTLLLSAIVHANHELHNLDECMERLGLPVVGRHTALGDAIMTGEVLLKFIPLLMDMGIETLGQARRAAKQTKFGEIRF